MVRIIVFIISCNSESQLTFFGGVYLGLGEISQGVVHCCHQLKSDVSGILSPQDNSKHTNKKGCQNVSCSSRLASEFTFLYMLCTVLLTCKVSSA